MLWAVAPLAASATALALTVGCAKGRETKPASKRPPPSAQNAAQQKKSSRSARGAKKSQRSSRSASRSGRSNRAKAVNSSKRDAKSGVAKNSTRSLTEKQKSSVRSTKSSKRETKPGAAVVSAAKKPTGSQRESKRSKRESKRETKPGAAAVVAAKGATNSKKATKDSQRSSRSNRSSRSSKRSLKSAKSSSSKRASKKDKKLPTATALAIDKSANAAAKKALQGPTVIAPSVPRIDLKMYPPSCDTISTEPIAGMQNVAVVNTSDKRRATKVKCSDNLLYRVNPVHAFVEPGECVRVDVLRQNGAAKVDKIVIVAADALGEEQDAKAALERSGTNTEMMILPLIATGAE